MSLKFKENVRKMHISEDFFYMIEGGGWCNPEDYLEEDDAKKVREAINIINDYERQGFELGIWIEC